MATIRSNLRSKNITPLIISHKLKVIFIKPIKVAGTSFQAALSEYCGENDIVCFSKRYEKHNLEKLQKFKTTFNNIFLKEHASAAVVKEIVPKDIWDNYLKVSIIRCPYDGHISLYYFLNKKLLGKYFGLWTVTKHKLEFPMNMNRLCINNSLAIDFLIRYEHLDKDIKKLEMKIGCPGLLETFNLISEKTNFRPPGRDIYTVYSKHPIVRAYLNRMSKEAAQNEIMTKYFPLYREKLSRKVPEPGYFFVFVANLLYAFRFSKKVKLSKPIIIHIKKTSKRLFGLRI